MRFENNFRDLLKKELMQDLKNKPYDPDFFGSAVMVARLSSQDTRLKIISDMAEALGCRSEELMFLFEDMPFNDNDELPAFPCFRQALILEAAE